MARESLPDGNSTQTQSLNRREFLRLWGGAGLVGLSCLGYGLLRWLMGRGEAPLSIEEINRLNGEKLNSLGLESIGTVTFEKRDLANFQNYSLTEELRSINSNVLMAGLNASLFALSERNPINEIGKILPIKKRNKIEDKDHLLKRELNIHGIFFWQERALLIVSGELPRPDSFGTVNPGEDSYTPSIGIVDLRLEDLKKISGLDLKPEIQEAIQIMSENSKNFDMYPRDDRKAMIVPHALGLTEKFKGETRQGTPPILNDQITMSVVDTNKNNPEAFVFDGIPLNGWHIYDSPYGTTEELYSLDFGRITVVSGFVSIGGGLIAIVTPTDESRKPSIVPTLFTSDGIRIDLKIVAEKKAVLVPIENLVFVPDRTWNENPIPVWVAPAVSGSIIAGGVAYYVIRNSKKSVTAEVTQ